MGLTQFYCFFKQLENGIDSPFKKMLKSAREARGLEAQDQNKSKRLGSGYSQLSPRRTPMGPALSVRLREMSVL